MPEPNAYLEKCLHDVFGRRWAITPVAERCRTCGQPDPHGRCDHEPLDKQVAVELGGQISQEELLEHIYLLEAKEAELEERLAELESQLEQKEEVPVIEGWHKCGWETVVENFKEVLGKTLVKGTVDYNYYLEVWENTPQLIPINRCPYLVFADDTVTLVDEVPDDKIWISIWFKFAMNG